MRIIIVLKRELIEKVKKFSYLGSEINQEGKCTLEIRRRLGIARSIIQKMETIWKSKGITTSLKVRLLRATSFAIASYGSESWATTKNDEKRIDAFEMWAYRRVLRVSWRERKTNQEILEMIGSNMMLRKSIAIRKMRMFGHVIRQDGLEKSIWTGNVEGRRKQGRPGTTWLKDITKWTRLGLAAAAQATKDRKHWRDLVKATAAQFAPSD